MARPSKLTDAQWSEIERRHVEGESLRALAKEFKVSESTIRERVSAQAAKIKDAANHLVKADAALKLLPVSAQVSAHNLADKLKSISAHLAGSAEYGAMTSHRLSMIANQQVDMIDESAALKENEDALKSIMAMTRGANDAAQTGLNLLNANKDAVNRLNVNPENTITRIERVIVRK